MKRVKVSFKSQGLDNYKKRTKFRVYFTVFALFSIICTLYSALCTLRFALSRQGTILTAVPRGTRRYRASASASLRATQPAVQSLSTPPP